MCSWYLARDTLGGRNFMDQDVKKAVVLLRDCRHDEARWLTSMFSGRSIATKQDVENALEDALLTQGDDPTALCFGSLFQTNSDGDVRLRKAAQLGHAFAQALFAGESSDKERFEWAKKSAEQGERDGMYQLACCYEYGLGCVVDREKARESSKAAALLGHVNATLRHAQLLSKLSVAHFAWLGLAAARGLVAPFVDELRHQVHLFTREHKGSPRVVCALGQIAKPHYAPGAGPGAGSTLFGCFYSDYFLFGAEEAVRFFDSRVAARRAVDAWSIVGKRMGVVKDVRLIIANLVWDAR